MSAEEYRWENALSWLHYAVKKGDIGAAELLEFITDHWPHVPRELNAKLEECFHDMMEEDGFFEPLPPRQDPEGSPRSAGDWAHP